MKVLEMKPKNPEVYTLDQYYQLLESGLVLPPAVRDAVVRRHEVPDLSELEPDERRAILDALKARDIHAGNGKRTAAKEEVTRGTTSVRPVAPPERTSTLSKFPTIQHGKGGLALLM